MSEVLFSLIIPSLNSELTIQHAVDSILRQTFKDFELFVLDGLSTDRTLAILSQNSDSRLSVFSEKDSGVYDAMNKAIKRANGQWIYFLGADDQLYDELVLGKIAGFIRSKNIDAIYGNVLRIPSNTVYDGEFEALTFLSKNISHQAIFLKRSLFTKFGLFDLKYKILSDWDHNLKWFFSSSVRKMYVDLIIATFADTGMSSTKVDDIFLNDLPEKFLQSVDAKAVSRGTLKNMFNDLAIKKLHEKKYFSFAKSKIKFWRYKFMIS